MKLDNFKFGDIQKLKAANETAKKTNKDAMGKLGDAKKMTSATEQAIESEAKELETTDD